MLIFSQPDDPLTEGTHELRESAGMTLTDLSRVAGVSRGLLSQIERGRGNPAYLTLLKIARACKVPVGRFFTQGEEPADNRVVRADSRRQLQVTDRELVYELLTPTMNGDSITYQGDQPHWVRVVGDAEAVIIATMTPPVF